VGRIGEKSSLREFHFFTQSTFLNNTVFTRARSGLENAGSGFFAAGLFVRAFVVKLGSGLLA
jgi:hypothetical protein